VHSTPRDLSPNFSCGAAGVAGRTSGRATADSVDGSDVPTLFSAVTVKVYSTSFFKPVSVQVVVAHCWLNPPPAAFTVYPVIGSPLSLGAVQDSTTLWLRTESTSGVLGASGRPLTTSETFAVACRLPSRVLSSTVYSTFMVPEKSA